MYDYLHVSQKLFKLLRLIDGSCPNLYSFSNVLLFILGTMRGKHGIINLCSFCPYSTSDLSNFKRHLLIHSGKRPFTCEICQKSFRRKEHLRGHLLTHLSSCEICFTTFNGKDELKNHMSTVHFM